MTAALGSQFPNPSKPLTMDEARAYVGREIRSTHRYGFRSGSWAVIEEAALDAEGPLWSVRWPDGTQDWWVAYDPSDTREIRDAS